MAGLQAHLLEVAMPASQFDAELSRIAQASGELVEQDCAYGPVPMTRTRCFA